MATKTTDPAISTRGLSKRYGKSPIYALNDLSIDIYPGEVYGLLGSNGAGKSTAIRLLMDFIRPTKGTATILGMDSRSDATAIKSKIGYLPGDAALYEKMTGGQFLAYMSSLSGDVDHEYTISLAKRLESDLSKKISELSRGNRQKIGLIQALMSQPEILILDEPTSGLDPLMQEVFYELVKEAKQRGATVLLSSHILTEVQKVCDRVGIIRRGELITEKKIADMALEASQTFEVVFGKKPSLTALRKVPGAEISQVHGNSVLIHVHGKLSPLLSELSKQEIVKIDSKTLDLEEVFLKFYGDSEIGGKS